MEQILINIDGKETQKAVEKVFSDYRIYKLTIPEEFLPSITPRYTLEMPSFSNTVGSKVEDIVIQKVNFNQEQVKFFNWFNKAFRKLTEFERKLITLCYLQDEPLHNYEVYRELNIAERTFYRARNRAIYKLALALGVEKYLIEEVKSS